MTLGIRIRMSVQDMQDKGISHRGQKLEMPSTTTVCSPLAQRLQCPHSSSLCESQGYLAFTDYCFCFVAP